ncbi:MAG: hypothetical protein RBU25_00495 [Lentisphaeria bacterium]|jgi:hypothetical protein|nr:hypothetical protein [Lentisphaeria bacterium]
MVAGTFRSFVAFYFIISSLWVFTCQADEAEDDFYRWVENEGQSRISGVGVFLSTTQRTGINLASLSRATASLSETEKLVFAPSCRARNIDLDLRSDVTSYRYEKIVFHQGRSRQEIADISPEEVEALRAEPSSAGSLKCKITVDDGTKVVFYDAYADPDNGLTATINRTRNGKTIFQQFGLCWDREKTRENIRTALKQHNAQFRARREGNMTYVSFSIAATSSSLEFVLERGEQLVAREIRSRMGGHLLTEELNSNFFRTSSGDWFPERREKLSYITLDGKDICLCHETIEVLGNSLDFNMHVDESLFRVSMPVGTILTDFTHPEVKEIVLTEANIDIDQLLILDQVDK